MAKNVQRDKRTYKPHHDAAIESGWRANEAQYAAARNDLAIYYATADDSARAEFRATLPSVVRFARRFDAAPLAQYEAALTEGRRPDVRHAMRRIVFWARAYMLAFRYDAPHATAWAVRNVLNRVARAERIMVAQRDGIGAMRFTRNGHRGDTYGALAAWCDAVRTAARRISKIARGAFSGQDAVFCVMLTETKKARGWSPSGLTTFGARRARKVRTRVKRNRKAPSQGIDGGLSETQIELARSFASNPAACGTNALSFTRASLEAFITSEERKTSKRRNRAMLALARVLRDSLIAHSDAADHAQYDAHVRTYRAYTSRYGPGRFAARGVLGSGGCSPSRPAGLRKNVKAGCGTFGDVTQFFGAGSVARGNVSCGAVSRPDWRSLSPDTCEEHIRAIMSDSDSIS